MKWIAVAAALLWAAPAGAKSSRELAYSYDAVWSSLVRFLRVDEKMKVVEKDVEAGYVLFEVVDGKRTFSGAAELSKGQEAGRTVTKVSIRINDRPSYMELGLLDRFEVKLREELGEPQPPPPAPPPAAPPAPPSDEKKPTP
jgi:hypothetical protein